MAAVRGSLQGDLVKQNQLRQATSDKRQATSNKQQATSNKQQAISSISSSNNRNIPQKNRNNATRVPPVERWRDRKS
ncbi:hypothetical protein [Xanthomonas campestris]|uniref:hypothetical protein n=1 Tax=Xanthomonas campestris TaxID=339 RepID=UPI001E493215|nr:hypothetical protein [Xanthomonas campestris]MCC5083114.1 hypothetical protein [Xanthomonas campestris]